MELRKLDVRGAKCPIPVVKAKKEIDTMAPGDLLEVTATDPGSMPDFVGWAETLLRPLGPSRDAYRLPSPPPAPPVP
jgi:TusA-related sulfurtransferase